MEIKKLNTTDIDEFKKLIELFNDVFEHEYPIPRDNHLLNVLSHEDFLVFIVTVNHTIVGGLTIYTLQSYYTEKPIAYIYDVAISPKHQGQGLGKTFISTVCDYCKQNGYHEVYVEAEADDMDAIGFYRKTAFSHELNAIHFTYSMDS